MERVTSKLPAEGEAPQDAEQHAQQSASQQACPEAQAEGGPLTPAWRQRPGKLCYCLYNQL